MPLRRRGRGNRPGSGRAMDPERRAAIVAEARRQQSERASGYREQALKLFPHVCARCGREYSGAQLRELTVHHKDHNHHNNPPDGSNWELLCVYCHDSEHQDPVARGQAERAKRSPEADGLGHQPFEGLKNLLPQGDADADADGDGKA